MRAFPRIRCECAHMLAFLRMRCECAHFRACDANARICSHSRACDANARIFAHAMRMRAFRACYANARTCAHFSACDAMRCDANARMRCDANARIKGELMRVRYCNYVNCVPRVCLEGALPNGVLSFWLHIPNSCSQIVSTSCARCLFMHCSIFEWLLRQRCAQRLCKGLPT